MYLGGNLVNINVETENAYVRSLFFTDDAWIGLSDLKNTEEYKWIKEGFFDEAPGYLPWDEDHPWKIRDCVAMAQSSSLWFTDLCDNIHPFICEKEN